MLTIICTAVILLAVGAIALRQEKIMSLLDDLKTEVESFVADVKSDVAALKAKIDALDNSNEDPNIQALIDEVKAAHADLAATVNTPPVPAEPPV